MIRALQVSLIISGIIPLALGIMNFTQGAGAPWLPGGIENPNTESQLRFYAIWFTAPFFFSVWMAMNLSRALPIAIIVFSVMAAAGFARLYSGLQFGWPEPPMIGAMVIEIGFLFFIPWIAFAGRRVGRVQAV